MYNERRYLLFNILKGVINSVVLLSQAEKSAAFNATDSLTRELALSKAEAYDNVINLLQENLGNSLNG